MRRELAIVFCLSGFLASCGQKDPGLEQRLEEVEAERDALERRMMELKERQSLLLSKKRDQISELEKELEEAKAAVKASASTSGGNDGTASNGTNTTSRPTPEPEPTPPPPKPNPKNVIFSDGGVEYFVGSDNIKRRVFRKSDGLAYVRIDGKDRLLPGVQNR